MDALKTLEKTTTTTTTTKARYLAMFAVALAIASPVGAQETREEQLASYKAKKATELHPYEPSRLESRLEHVERFDTTLFSPGPAYLFVGTTFDGGGIAAGPGYRARFRDTGSIDAHAAWSIRNYKAVDGTLKLPTMFSDRVGVEMRANWIDAPAVAFFGTGNGSLKSNRTDFAYEAKTVGVAARIQAAEHFAVGGGLDVIDIATDITSQAASPTYQRNHVFAEYDWRTSPGYTKRGGLYRVDFSDYRQSNAGTSSFRRIDAEAQQFVPLMRENWVLAFRALASSADTTDGNDIPYFMLPDLGGSQTLRGYSAWRFRDRNRMLLTGEYRWTAGPLVDMALFMDAGKVASRFGDLDLRDLKKSYGIGMSVHTPISTVTRIELARTSEGNSLVLSFSPSF